MSVKTLFNIILKVLGFFFINDILTGITQLFSIFFMFGTSNYSSGLGMIFIAVIISLLIISVYIAISYFLIFRSDYLISKLKLDSGFDADIIPLNVHRSTVLSISIIVIGGLMIVDHVPDLCRQLYSYYQMHAMLFDAGKNIPNIIFAAVKVAIGIILIGFQRPIVNLIELKRKG